ncbi:MAG TPA: hypothetical protein PKE14_02380 [Chitinophagales bacterium]|nr:hypothetical protein [Chitinophagales bacterium]HMX03485.1 hypothetical protein [Chitinophagales bacterium]HNM28463.1 hypothetical protein [Chitinophagales bacterium]
MRAFTFFILQLSFFLIYAQPCDDRNTEYIPIADLGSSTFQEYQGGLYPNGSNAIPMQHFQEGLSVASHIKPLNAEGKEDSISGKIGFLILGYSTAAMTGRFFRDVVAIKSPDTKLQVVIGAQGGRDINSMTDSLSSYWDGVDSALHSNTITAAQIQLIWISTGDILTYSLPFPQQSLQQVDKYALVLKQIKLQYPNARIVFLSDRPFAGYIGVNGMGPKELAEPTAYFHSWTVKWVIEHQMNNDAGFTKEEIPFIDWGPTLWTNGSKGDKQGYTWNCDDAGKGGIHASSKGRMKEATRMYVYFSNHPYTEQLFK